MEYRYMGRTGIRVSPLCIGTRNFGTEIDLEESRRIVSRALDAGINIFDTANVYGVGKSEEYLGKAIKESGSRDHVVICTKVHGDMHGSHQPLNPNRWGNSRRGIMMECENSLRRLQADWIDLYIIHQHHVECAIDEALRAMDDLVRTGKVRYIGSSNFTAWKVVEALWASDRLALNRLVVEHPHYSLLDRRIEREVIPMAQTYSIALMPWSPLVGGFLTGKYRRDGSYPEGAMLGASIESPDDHRFTQDASHDVVDGIARLAQRKGCATAQLALAWCMQQPGITSPIYGPRTVHQLEDVLGATELAISDEDREEIDKIIAPGTMVVPCFEGRFGPHLHRI